MPLTAPAFAEVSAQDMAQVRGELLRGNADRAIEILKDLLVDTGDSPFVYYALGEAYTTAANQTDDTNTARAYLQAAQNAFESAIRIQDTDMRANAVYNAANSLAELGQSHEVDREFNRAGEYYLQALEAYDLALGINPDHSMARHNRAWTRLKFKQLPPEEEQEQEPQPEGEDEQEEQPEDDQEQEPQEQPEGDQEQPEQPEGEEERPQDQERDEGEEESGEDGQQPPPPPQPQDPSQQQEPEDMPMQDFEALLDNLMDIDDEEQRELRREPRSQQAIGEWW